jgi:hypothetical protein
MDIMGMSPYQYLNVFVWGNYDDFESNPDCVRRGVNAVISASHMADHYYNYYKRKKSDKVNAFNKLEDYLNYLYNNCNFFRDIRSIANACKHLYSTRSSSTIDSAGRIEVLKLPKGNISEISYDIPENKNQATVIFTRKTGERFELLPSLQEVVDFWNKEVPYE